jgi:hypothetical protein
MDTYTQRDNKENRTIEKRLNKLSKNSEKLLISDGFHTKKNSQISLNFRNFFDKNFNNQNLQEKPNVNLIYNNKQTYKNIELNKSTNNPPKLNNENKFKFTKNYISPTIIYSNSISKSNQKYLNDQKITKRNSTSAKTSNENTSLSKNPMKIFQNSSNVNINNSMKFEGNYNNNSVNYNNINNLNLNYNNNNNSLVKNTNLNYLNINSNYENDSFVYKSSGANTNIGIFQKNTDLNFTNKFTEGNTNNNTTSKDTINIYDVNKKVR